MINNKMKIDNTGLHSILVNTLFDGEFITHDLNRKKLEKKLVYLIYIS